MSPTLNLARGALVFFVVAVPPASALAQTPAHVRVVKESARVARWLRPADTLLEIEAGTTLEVLDKDSGRYWVILPADVHGTRRSGWIRTDAVEAVVLTPPPGAGDDAGAAAAASHEPAPAAAPEEMVTITSAPAATGAPARRVYSFEAVHFDRNRASLRPDAMERLRSIAAAFQADPALAVNLEGHTCSLGSAAYNRSLGLRRAEAVREYLVQQGVAPDRLHAISRGEEHPEHDNAREQTRQLNRRVTLTPDTAR
jgi:outer membrane protein OmpA-like peptidoglycan-associated protein